MCAAAVALPRSPFLDTPLPQILPTCVFNKKDPIVVGVEVKEGIAKVGSLTLCLTLCLT